MIGFFDSGVGGLTISESVHELLPEYDTIYLGDTARAPYGARSKAELFDFTIQGAEWLFNQGCELIIVACNSASAGALREVQQKWLAQKYPNKRMLGIIRPTVEELALAGYKNIVVLSTVATKDSQAYVHEFHKINPNLKIFSHACPKWGPMVETGFVGTVEMATEVDWEIKAMESEVVDYDAVLLACTHYPYVKKDVENSLTKKVPVFNQGEIVAKSLKDYLSRRVEIETKLAKNGRRNYYTTGDPVLVSDIASKKFGFPVTFKKCEL